MIYNIDEHVQVQVRMLMHAYYADRLMNESLDSGSIRLLYEAINPEEVKEDIVETKKIMLKIKSLFPPDKAKTLIAEFQKLIDAIPDASKVETELFAGDDKKMKEIAKVVSTNTTAAVRAAATLANALQQVSKALQPFIKELSEDEKKKTIEELLADPATKDKFMPADKFEAGIKKSFFPSKEYESALQKGIKAMQTRSAGDGKSKIGQFFSSIGKFFAGLTQKKPAAEAFPKLYAGFKEFLTAATMEEIVLLSGKVQATGSKLIVTAAQNAAEAGAATGAVATGAPVQDGPGAATEKKKVKADDLEKHIAGKYPGAAKAIIAALKKDEKTRDLLEGKLFRENGMPNLKFMLSETVSYDEILKIIQSADPAFTKKPEKAQQYAAKVAKFMKSNGADVDDKGAPEIKEEEDEEQPQDSSDATAAADKAAAEARAAASKTTMGKAIHKAIIDYVQPYASRESLSKKARAELTDAIEKGLSDSIDKAAAEAADFSTKKLKDALTSWVDNLDPKLQSKLGGKVGYKKVSATVSKNIEDIIKTNFKIEENRRKAENDLIVERWQRLAGIK